MLEPIVAGLIAQAPANPGGAPAGGGIVAMLPFVLMFAVVYFLMIRPQQKQQKQHRQYLAGLKVGDEVVTNSGILGKIEAIEDRVIRLEIARDVKIRVLKTQIAGAQPGQAPEPTGAGSATAAKKS